MTEKENKDSQRINKVAPVSDAGENPNTVAAAKPEKKRKKESFEVIKGYATRECGSLVVGAIFLIGAILSDLATPYYIGKVIDLLQKGDFDGIGELSIYMLIVILVSISLSTLGYHTAVIWPPLLHLCQSQSVEVTEAEFLADQIKLRLKLIILVLAGY